MGMEMPGIVTFWAKKFICFALFKYTRNLRGERKLGLSGCCSIAVMYYLG
jgi:hypothetical protein